MEDVTQPTPTTQVLPQVQTVKNEESNKNTIVVILSVIIFLLIVIMSGGLYYFYTSTHPGKLEKTSSVTNQPTVTPNNLAGLIQNKILLGKLSPSQKNTDLSLSIYDIATKQQKQFTTSGVNFQNPLSVTLLSPNHKLLLVPTNPNTLSEKGTIIIYTLATGSSITITNPLDANHYTGNFVWSPDSTKIVLVSGGTGQSEQLYIVNADGTGLQQLTNDNDNLKINPLWSPDGQHIMYGSQTDQNSHVKEYNLVSKTTSDMTPTNSQTKEIMPSGDYFNDIHHTVGWIDNDHLVTFYAPKDAYSASSNTGVWLITLSTGEAKQLAALPVTFDSQGLLSEDKKFLSTYSSDTNTNKITYYLVRTDGSGTESYTVDKGKSQYPFFSPDGKHLAYQDNLGFWVHDFTTKQNSKIMDLTHEQYTTVSTLWSPDSTELALKATIIGGASGAPVTSQVEKDNEGFWVSNADGTNLRKIDSTSNPLYWY